MDAMLSDKKLTVTPISPPNGPNGPLSPPLASPFASGAMTPSFAPNVSPDYLTAHNIAVPGKPLYADDLDLPENLDLSLPISELLKIGTQRAHADAEHSEGAKELMRGTLGLEEYIRWNVILWRVYDALELALSEHYDHPVLAPTYDPRTLSRSSVLAKDISHLLTLIPTTSPSSAHIPPHKLTALSTPLPPFGLPAFLLPVFTTPPTPLQDYITHIKTLSSTDVAGLLAHAYVRYLGDMSGGQFIAARIKRSYSLKGADGLRFFHFDQSGRGPEELEGEGGGETKKRLGELKDWYRRGMNEGVGEDQELKAHLVKEANLAFALNTHLFSLIQPTATTDTKITPARVPAAHKSEHISSKTSASAATRASSTMSTIFNRNTLGRILGVLLALVIGQAMKKVGPYLAQRWGFEGAKAI